MRFVVGLLFLLVILQSAFNSSFALAETSGAETSLIADTGGSWAGKRSLIIEPGFQYTHNSSNRIDLTGLTLPGLVIGLIQVEKVRRDILTPSVSLRFGVSEFFQINLKVPYLYRSDKFTNRPGEPQIPSQHNTVNDHALGDIEGGILFHLLKETPSRPQVIAGLKAKSRTGRDPYGLARQMATPGTQIPAELPTGTGHWALEPYVTVLKVADPAVLFANLGYFYHMERTIDGIGKVDPSDSVNLSFGIGYALNDKLALSTAFEQKIYTRAKVDGRKLAETDPVVATLLLGATYAFSPRTAMNLTLGVGLTEDSPDMQVSINFPIRFSF
ncbi:transporter [Geoalkalibacter halelectricus]|uniref:Transporter n=1 Tax=Geoalkalibacter halelectricus TaxID=2847045 RepID=A0ABY5ZIP5_9BACT|nr:transporter [Geoalkalibacter halelectricus]MDO3378955.1 transporter [Geoalkalibacter halelectricus]UWZ79022.1 transporter [Geoalkalibacter halelectricus]